MKVPGIGNAGPGATTPFGPFPIARPNGARPYGMVFLIGAFFFVSSSVSN